MDPKIIGKLIYSKRKYLNMTQHDLAIKLNVTDSAVSKWERGKGLPDTTMFKQLCKVLSLNINDFFV